MALSYNLAYHEIISVHPTRRQIFAGKSDSTFWNIWQWVTRKLILILWGVPSVVFKGEKYYFRVYVHFQGNANGLEPSWMLPHCIACFFCFWPIFQFNHFPSTARAFVDISCVRKYLDNLEVSNTSHVFYCWVHDTYKTVCFLIMEGIKYFSTDFVRKRERVTPKSYLPRKWNTFFSPKNFYFVQHVTLNSLVTLVTKDFLATSFAHQPNTSRPKCFKGLLPNQDQLFQGTSLSPCSCSPSTSFMQHGF